MKLTNTITATALTAMLFMACKKDNTTQPSNNNSNNNPAVTTQAELLQDGKWMVTVYMVDFTSNGIPFSMNVYDSLDQCSKDDLYLYKSNGRLYIDQGATKCTAAAPQIDSSANWTLSGTKLTWDVGGDKMEYDVLNLTSTELKTKMLYYDSTEKTNYTYTVTYKNMK